MTDDTAVTADWYHEDKATLGDRLTWAREAAGLSQQALAKRLGVKLSTLKRWEDDLAEPRANRLTLLSGLLNVSLKWLLTGQGADHMEGGAGAEVSRAEVAALRGKLAEAMEMLARMEARLGHE